MTFVSRFFTLALSLCLLPTVLLSVPLHPDTESKLRTSGQFEIARAAYLDAKTRGVNQPTPYPVDLQAMAQMDRTELKVLTILVDFSDNPADTVNFPTEHYEELVYSLGSYPTGSVRDYFIENSLNEVDIVGEVAGWYRMPMEYSWYVDGNYGFGSYPQNAQRLTEDAVWAADPDVDFSEYDNDNDGIVDALFVVHAGPGAETTGSPLYIWSHAWTTYSTPYLDGVYIISYSQEPEDGHIGVFGHELGHALLGLPDLYDYDYDSHGTGMWSMMSGGCWGNNGITPVHFDAWSKVKSGMLEVINVESDEEDVAIPQVETEGIVYRLWTEGQDNDEYFMVENRQRTGFDVSLPGSGLMIYHVEEETGSNNNQWYPGYTQNGHYLVAVEQADGYWNLEHYASSGDAGDPWSNTTFGEYSTPDSRNYDFEATAVAVRNISASNEVMYADFEIGLFIPTGQELILESAVTGQVLPDFGGTVEYHAEAMNHEAYSAQMQFWTMIILPDGSLYGPLAEPHGVTIPPLGFIEADFVQWVPEKAPSGTYTLVGYIGTYPDAIEDSTSFTFNKGPMVGVGTAYPGMDGWSSEGGFDTSSELPETTVLHGAYPNPFNPATTISFQLSSFSHVNVSVYDVSARLVTELIDGWRAAGIHEVTFNAAGLASGVYMVQLNAGGSIVTGKLVLMK
jgi:immune inhibitor A